MATKDFTAFTAVDEVMDKLSRDVYLRTEMKTDDLVAADSIQVRLIGKADKNRVNNIVDRFDESVFDPVIVIVDDNGNVISLLDGNHRVAVQKKRKAAKTPTIQIPYIDLYESKAAALKLGHKLNVNVIDKEECSNSDIKALIKQDMREGVDVRTAEYLREISDLFQKNPTGMGRIIQAALRDEHPIYRTFEDEELQEAVESIASSHPDRIVYRSGMRVAPEQGFGALLRQMSRQGNPKGLLVIYPAKVDDMMKYEGVYKEISLMADRFDLDIQVIQLELPRK